MSDVVDFAKAFAAVLRNRAESLARIDPGDAAELQWAARRIVVEAEKHKAKVRARR